MTPYVDSVRMTIRTTRPCGPMDNAFELDPRLAADSVPVTDLPLSAVRLMTDGSFPWLLLVPRRPDLVELIDLSGDDQRRLMDEIAAVCHALRTVTDCDKLNVAALGNSVSQLHVHVIARYAGDAAWPGPVWGKVPPAPRPEDTQRALIETLRIEIAKQIT